MKKYKLLIAATLFSLTGTVTFLYSSAFATTMQDIGNLSGTIVSSDGTVIVGQDQDSQQGYKYTNGALTDLGSIGSNSAPLGISADGSTIVGSDYTSANNAFIYTQSGGMVNFMNGASLPSGGTDTFAHSISADGSTIAGAVYGASNPHILFGGAGYILFKYKEGAVTYPRDGLGSYIYLDYYNGGAVYPGLNPNNNGGFSHPLIPISADGSVIAGTYYYQDYHVSAFTYAAGSLTSIGNLYNNTPNYNSYTMALSADGSTVVGWSTYNASYDEQAFKYTSGGGLVGLGFLSGGTNSYANAVSRDGSVIVGSSRVTDNYMHAFKYTDTDGMVDLGTLGGNNSYGYAVSGNGNVIVGNSDTDDGQSHAFAYYQGAMRDLGTLGGDTSYAQSVSYYGSVITGMSNLVPSGTIYHAFLYNFAKLIDTTNTQTTVSQAASSTRSFTDLTNARQAAMADYDCSSFGDKKACLAISGRYTTSSNKFGEAATSLIAGYKVNDNIRLGAFVDYAGTLNSPSGIGSFTNNPSLGSFIGYSQHQDNKSGIQAKIISSFDSNSLKITRTALSNTEAGAGRAKLASTMLAATLGYGFNMNKKTVLTPFVGLRYTKINRAAYTESASDNVVFPVSYAKYNQELTTASFGGKIDHAFDNKTSAHFSAMLESDIISNFSNFSYYMPFYGSFALSKNSRNPSRTSAQAGLLYNIEKDQTIGADIMIKNQVNNRSKLGATAILTYKLAI